MMLSAAGMSLVGLFGKLGLHDLSVAALMFWRYASASLLLFFSLLLLGRLEGACDFGTLKSKGSARFFFFLRSIAFFIT